MERIVVTSIGTGVTNEEAMTAPKISDMDAISSPPTYRASEMPNIAPFMFLSLAKNMNCPTSGSFSLELAVIASSVDNISCWCVFLTRL